MRRRLLACLALVSLLALGCFRTQYLNLHPPLEPPDHPPDFETPRPFGWQSFFLYGWIPGVKDFDAAEECLGTAHVDRIETRQTFLEGLVAAYAGFIVNIYSPWNARVICDHTAEPEPDA